MKILSKILGLFLVISIVACENDVEINSEFKEVTAVYGIIEPSADTQYIRVARTFLDDNLSAIQLAQDPDRIYYDSLEVKLLEKNNDNVVNTILLRDTVLPKKPGLFTQDDNVVYYTTETINADAEYQLDVTLPDGSKVTSTNRTTEGVFITSPNSRNTSVSFISRVNNSLSSPEFEFTTGENAGEFETVFKFIYIEIDNQNDSTEHEIIIPLARFRNSGLAEGNEFRFTLDALRFFEAIEDAIPPSLNPPRRIWKPEGNILIETYCADGVYSLYREVNGPIDGLAQTRPEYSNIENGIGIFASRQQLIRTIKINDDTRNYIISNYGDRANNASQFRGFSRP